MEKNYNYKKALEYSEEAKNLSIKIGAKRPLVEMYEILDKSNYQLGNYKQAHQYQANWAALKDSIFSVEKTTEIASLEAKKQKELNEKIAKLRQQMQEELLNELTPDQQAQYKEMMGEAFKFEQQQRGGLRPYDRNGLSDDAGSTPSERSGRS